MKKRRALAIVTFVTLFMFTMFLLGCSDKTKGTLTNAELDERTVLLDIRENPKEKAPYGYFPLTGEVVPEALASDYRAFGVMIENSLSARPQSGLYQADIVYEVLSEGTITRFLAIFHSQQPERIGPIRSARSYYVHLNKGYDAIYVNAGGSPGGLNLAQSSYVDDISGLAYDGRFFTRSRDRSAPHNMYTTYDDLVSAANQIGYEMDRKPPELYIEQEARAGDKVASTVEINYGSSSNNVRYNYDEDTRKYSRFVGGQPSLDLDTNEPVMPKNIFIIEANHRVIPKGEDHIDAGSNRREINIESGGKGYLVQEGSVTEVEWKNEDGLILPYKDDELLPFLRGQTWINIVPSGNGGLEAKVNFAD
ncbi:MULTISPECIES: DUF3048 domain-containing protein [Bacillaceae]|uniref:DUF3048 domain-containing protein n=1 Tax=Evansella alkalicola TaxID=745819 RepID=A0ABS6JT60_9BACI|nr:MULTISPECIES: DUF3048 domain-containing protein [Bacillaceae]MBU9721261.1 DUF3048 domain-containing protein [Bacillus alkalicola]